VFKRIFLFITVNILVLLTISITLSVLGVQPYLNEQGINYEALLIFCGVVGFTGAFISLAMSRWMAKMMMGVQVIDPTRPGTIAEKELLQTVHRLAQKAGLSGMPEVGVYDSPEVNAFATGPTKARSLVAVSSGLLHQMDNRAVEGVLAHEVAHIANGDMVTMTLLQGVVNTFVMFFARIAAWGVSNAMARNSDDNRGTSPWVHMICVWVFEIMFSLLGAIVVAAFSRWREFRADAGGARLAGKEKMVYALQSLKNTLAVADDRQAAVASLKINGKPSSFMALFASHPDLDTRIEALRKAVV
jgi:heat shock protein HtpX